MSDQSEKGITAAQRIRGLKRRIDRSLMELTDLEVVLNTRPHTAPLDNARLEKKKLLLTRLSSRKWIPSSSSCTTTTPLLASA